MADQDSKYDVADLYGSGGCEEALHVLYEYLDGELTSDRREAIERHLKGCSPCLHAFDFEAELKVTVARSCRDQVPADLRARVAAALARASDPDAPDARDAGTPSAGPQHSGSPGSGSQSAVPEGFETANSGLGQIEQEST